MFRSVLILFAFSSLTSCEMDHRAKGTLVVHSSTAGTYDIFQIRNETSSEIFSEIQGQFNSETILAAGTYLVLADCSSRTVLIKPNGKIDIYAHQILFNKEGDQPGEFTVECTRNMSRKFRQKTNGQFEFNVVSNSVDLLVGMSPVVYKFEEVLKSQKISVNLSSVRIDSKLKGLSTADFFVSKSREKIALTQSQKFGRRIFLLPGEYRVELNGTFEQVELKENDHRSLSVGYFSIDVTEDVEVKTALEVRGSPLDVTINENHSVALNELFPALPGPLNYRLFGSDRTHEIEILADETVSVPIRSVTVDSKCSAWYWECLGRRKIYLYQKGKTYAFAEGVTDVPVLFVGDDAWVGVEGSYDIRYRLVPKKRNISLNLGYVTVKPKPSLSSHKLTDLLRIETLPKSRDYFGQTLDIDLMQKSSFALISGYYMMANYATLNRSHKRTSNKRGFAVRKGDNVEIEVPIHLTERRYQRYLAKRKKLESQQLKSVERRWRSSYRPGKRLKFQ